MVKKKFFSSSTASSQCRPAELFRVIAHHDDFAQRFKEKIAQVRHELDSTVDIVPLGEVSRTPSGPALLDEFQLMRLDDVDKKAVIRPVLKKASLGPEIATNYRPVANIPFLGKVLEWVVAGQVQTLFDETDYQDPFQSGFRPGYGTESALVTLYDDLCRGRDRGSASLLVLLDLSAASDAINHGILLDRLSGLGVGGTAWQWFCSYLAGRFQKVVLGDFGSAPWQLCHGVPQGSILSPLLFNVYMKPLGEVIRRFGLQSHQYADDTQLYLSFSTNPGKTVAVLNQCLAEYAMFLSLVFLAELVAGISGFVFRHEIKDTFLRTYTEAIQNYNGNDEKSHAVDDVQESLRCCGVQNYTNWHTSPYFNEHGIPISCCMNTSDCNSADLRNATIAPTKINQKGCYDLVTSFMETNMGIIAGVAFGIAFSQHFPKFQLLHKGEMFPLFPLFMAAFLSMYSIDWNAFGMLFVPIYYCQSIRDGVTSSFKRLQGGEAVGNPVLSGFRLSGLPCILPLLLCLQQQPETKK
ncbi:Tetraspanin-7 [Varanus komodoensis]|nr:Tetraspanin-7 [Varanus komodoensis]